MAAKLQDCRSSGPSVRAWCKEHGVSKETYYRWEQELLTGARRNGTPTSTAVTFAELSASKQEWRNVVERSATLRISNASLDIYSGCDAEQLKMLVHLRVYVLRLYTPDYGQVESQKLGLVPKEVIVNWI